MRPYSPDGLAQEPQREVGPLHPLFSKSAKAIALARDRDDVLFEIAHGSSLRYAVVHLTWSGKAESSADFPGTQLFDSLSQWIEWMKADHDDYTYGGEDRESP